MEPIFQKCPTCGITTVFKGDRACRKCLKKERAERLSESIRTGARKSTSAEEEIFCPWCGDVIKTDDKKLKYTAGIHRQKCPDCKKQFQIKTQVIFSYSTERV